MDDISFKEVWGEDFFAESVWNRLPPDSAVLFHAAGRFADNDYVPALIRIAADESYARVSPDTEIADMEGHSPQAGFRKFRAIVRDNEDMINLVQEAAVELFTNASHYGVDALAVPAIYTGLEDPEGFEKCVVKRNAGLKAVSFASIAVLHAQSTNQLWFLTQNFVSEHAAENLVTYCRRINTPHSLAVPLNLHLSRRAETRAANPQDQPLLQKGGPVGSAIHPQGYLRRPYCHYSIGAGKRWIARSKTGPAAFAITDADIRKIEPRDETHRALEEAAKRLKTRPERLKSFTLAVPFNAG